MVLVNDNRLMNQHHPAARTKVAARLFIDRTATPPRLRRGACCFHHHSAPSDVCHRRRARRLAELIVTNSTIPISVAISKPAKTLSTRII